MAKTARFAKVQEKEVSGIIITQTQKAENERQPGYFSLKK